MNEWKSAQCIPISNNAPPTYIMKDNVTSSKASAFRQDLLKFLGGSASDEGSDQGQGVRVEISLKRRLSFKRNQEINKNIL